MSAVKQKIVKLDYFVAKRPIPGHRDNECGDMGMVKEFDNKLFVAVLDTAGHSKKSYKLAVICRDCLEKNYQKDLVEVMNELDKCIKDSKGTVVARGAVGALCLLDIKTGELKCVGVGNIVIRKFGSSTVRIIPRSGIIGYVMPTPRQEIMKLYDRDVLLLYTDGVVAHFELNDYPELLRDDAKTIATHVIQQFGKEEDDAACMALRFSRSKND